jgi:hypothetical protein
MVSLLVEAGTSQLGYSTPGSAKIYNEVKS